MGKELSLFSDKKELPSFLTDASADTGNEGVGIDDLAIPQLKILQPLSPELMMNIEGAKAGMFMNSVTHDVYPEIYVVNIMYRHNFAVFKTREAGGGKQAEAQTKKEALEIIAALPGNSMDYQVVDTGIHSLLALDETGKPLSPMLLYCSSTKKAVSQAWNTQIQLRCQEHNVPRYATVWLMNTTTESNSKGTWYGFRVSYAGLIQDEGLFLEAQKLRSSLEEQSDWENKALAAPTG